MSFGGFGGFGSNNNNNQSTGFGGFGANNNNNNSGGFGSNTNTGAGIFGSSNNATTGSNMFGSNTQNSGSLFGGGGGFGANNNTAKTTFGSTPFGGGATGGGLFGGSSSGNTFGGFGSNNNNNSTTPAFGASNNNTGGGLFGANKSTGFGASASTGTGLFGGGNTGGFGASNTATTNAFGGGGGGFGAGNNNANQPNNGTANVPFQAVSEKDGTSNTATVQYQTITFQQPYQNYSLEELRLADYNQGRRYGNQNGQAGAFGQNTGFGGFGSNNNTTTSAFGSNNNTSGGGLFGSGNNNTSTTSAFGSTGSAFGANNNNTGGGLFGANKPATGGLFGGSNTTTGSTGGGLFGGGSSTTNTGGFGSGTSGGFGSTANNNTGGGLFGANKPATGGLFGNTGTTNTASTGFGASAGGGFGTSTNTNTGGGLFGGQNNNQAAATPAFGTANTTSTTGGGLFGGGASTGTGFGQNNQTNTQSSGGLFGGGFGQNNQNNQQKPGGLFGGSTTTNTTGGGLFGGSTSNANTAGGGLFGGSTTNNNASSGGGLFGQKPATTGNSLFGGSTTNTAQTGGGLFGNLGTQNNQQQSSSSGLFGGQNNQQKPGGLFGNSTTTTNTGGGGLFGNLGQQNNNQSSLGGSLFQSQNQPQQNQQPNGNSLFGASGSSLLNTSMNINPYGNDSLFANLATPTQSPGPIATPLSSSQKNKKSAILPQHKLNPSASTRLLTPQNKRPGGYGFTYSTYGTPASASSQNNAGLGGSLFAGGSLSRSLGKSLSTSNLRNSFTPEASILSPGAFSTTSRNFGNGSLKRLNVNRSMQTRIPLFDEPSHKRVSFANGEDSNGSSPPQTVRAITANGERDASPKATGDDARTSASRSPNHQTNGGSELSHVDEHSALTTTSASSLNSQPGSDPKPGDYWSRPSMASLKKMSKQELRSVSNFVVGRTNIGEIRFNEGRPVDISELDLDRLFDDIVVLKPRNATVYGETCSCLPKPARGTALNQPSEIALLNSWPRNKAGKKDAKHLDRLKRVAGTEFRNYSAGNGEWTFAVPHFSSYGLDYENDYSDEDDLDDASSELSDAPDTPAQQVLRSSRMTSTPQGDSFDSPTQSQSSPDDTFDFKRGMRTKANVPGGFGNDIVYEEEDLHNTLGQSFLGQRSVGSFDGHHDGDYSDEDESEQAQDQSMADSVSGPVHTTEQATATEEPFRGSLIPKSILKASQFLKPGTGTPSKAQPVFDDDWANQLQRTISPKKQDRQALRESQGNALREHDEGRSKFSQSFGGDRPMTTAMDLMDSLFGESEKQKVSKRGGHGIELPYSKRPKTASELDQLSDADKEFHSCSKPHFSEANILVYGNKGHANLEQGAFLTAQEPIIGAEKDVRFMAMPTFQDSVTETIRLQMQHTRIILSENAPKAIPIIDPVSVDFAEVAKAVGIDTASGSHEQRAWQLLALLFDADAIPADVGKDEVEIYKKTKLSEFWKSLVWKDAKQHAQEAASLEERALAQLSCNNVPDACHALLDNMDLRLATMVAQIGGDLSMRQSMLSQIEEWRRLDVLSEMEDSHRALYELLSGNCSRAEGKFGSGRENKASTFNICSRFALDWRRAFGLRLWYGTMHDEPIELAVAQFHDALRDGKEDVKPVPWYVEQGVDMGWNDTQAEDREDILWSILKLYAAPKEEGIKINVEKALAPENVSGHPLNARLSFQLFQLFQARLEDDNEEDERKIGMPTNREDDDEHRMSYTPTRSARGADAQAEHPLTELGDKITLTYAASLHTAEHWTTAVWVYAHLSSAATREHHIRSLLNQFSNTYSLDESNTTYNRLTMDMRVPVEWLHAAAALQAKADGDALRQATHLIKADEFEEAHEVLCRQVGPDAIISRDYDPLRELVGGFIKPVQGWAQGGQIYFDYIDLIDLTGQQQNFGVDEELNKRIEELLIKLQRALEIVGRDRLHTCGLEERVALMEIAGTVANFVAKSSINNRGSVLKLPLTEDLWLKHSCNLSANYYRSIMAGGR